MSITTHTALQLYRLIGNELGRAAGRATAGSTTRITDTSTDAPFLNSDDLELFKNAWALIEGLNGTDAGASPAAPQGEVRRIASYTPSSQLVDTDATNAFTSTILATHDYGIYMAIPPERVGMIKGIKEYINDALRETYYHTLDLATEAQDVGMETGGTPTANGWTATTATLAYATTAATGVQIGSSALKVTTSGINGYAQQSFNVRGSESWDVAVDLIGTTGGDIAKLVITSDGTGPTTTTITANASEVRSQRLFATHSVPSDATVMYVRLQGAASGDIAYWDNLSVRRSVQTEIALPSWVQDPSWVEDAEMWIPGTTGATGIGTIDDTRRARFMWWKVVEDHTGTTPFRLQYYPVPRNDAHIVFKAIRSYAEISTLASTTACNQDYLKARCLAAIYADLGEEKKAARWAAQSQGLARAYDAAASKQQPLQLKEAF